MFRESFLCADNEARVGAAQGANKCMVCRLCSLEPPYFVFLKYVKYSIVESDFPSGYFSYFTFLCCVLIFGDLLQTMDPESVQEGQKRMKALFQKYAPLSDGLFFLYFIGVFLSCFSFKGSYLFKCTKIAGTK